MARWAMGRARLALLALLCAVATAAGEGGRRADSCRPLRQRPAATTSAPRLASICLSAIAGAEDGEMQKTMAAGGGSGGGALEVADEAQLRVVLASSELGWSDRRVVRLVANILLTTTLVIGSPVHIQGSCPSEPGGRCLLTAAPAPADADSGSGDLLPLLHITGPAAVVEMDSLHLQGGRGTADMAGGLTASNHSRVDLISVHISGCSAPWGAGLRADSHANVNLVRSSIADNGAQQAGGGVYAHASRVHLERSEVSSNSAGYGGGIYLASGSRLTAAQSAVKGNRLTSNSLLAEGADVLFAADGSSAGESQSTAYFDPLPGEGEISVAGGQVHPLALLLNQQVPPEWRRQQAITAAVEEQQASRQGWVRQQATGLLSGETEAAAAAEAAAAGDDRGQAGRSGRRRLRDSSQQPTAVPVTNESELGNAIANQERYISLLSHIILLGTQKTTMVGGPGSDTGRQHRAGRGRAGLALSTPMMLHRSLGGGVWLCQ